ncbi:hypothetical protein [Yoonia algicola]|uniref:Uncharacterized protein n=1 Tax=Yoonia algicola TaxID=3137368 RepID=A0AAN0M5W8_9RHOB
MDHRRLPQFAVKAQRCFTVGATALVEASRNLGGKLVDVWGATQLAAAAEVPTKETAITAMMRAKRFIISIPSIE